MHGCLLFRHFSLHLYKPGNGTPTFTQGLPTLIQVLRHSSAGMSRGRPTGSGSALPEPLFPGDSTLCQADNEHEPSQMSSCHIENTGMLRIVTARHERRMKRIASGTVSTGPSMPSQIPRSVASVFLFLRGTSPELAGLSF